MQLQQAYETFIADKRINGCSKETIRFYNYSIGRLLSFVQKDRVVETDDLGPRINPYFLYLHESGLSPHSIQALFRGTRAFTRFLLAEGFIESAIRLPRIKPTTSVIKPLSVDQMRTILTSIDTSDFVGLRNWTLLRLFFDTGMRLGEVCRLDTSHVNLDDGFVLVHGKGGKERWVPVGREMKKALWAYMKRRTLCARLGEPALFVQQDGTRLSPRGVQMFFKRLKIKLDGVRFSPHTLRHSFALSYIENGGDPFSLQRILGHSTQAMTAKYVNMARSNIKAQHDRFSPGDRL
jgi:site-specific recombinase XerD